MVIIIILLPINWPLSNLFSGVPPLKSKCSIDKHGQFYYIPYEKPVFDNHFVWPALVCIAHLSWDLSALIFMYRK